MIGINQAFINMECWVSAGGVNDPIAQRISQRSAVFRPIINWDVAGEIGL
jgi:hypothetical protein